MSWRCTIAMCAANTCGGVAHMDCECMGTSVEYSYGCLMHGPHTLLTACCVLALLQLWSSASSQLWPRCPWQWAASA